MGTTTRRIVAGLVASVIGVATAEARAQEITLAGPLSWEEPDDVSPAGLSITIHGMSGTMVADTFRMSPAPGSTPPPDLVATNPQLDGDGAYLGSGFRMFYVGEVVRAGGGLGAMLLDPGMTRMAGATGRYRLRPDTSWGAHLEVFAGAQLDWLPMLPYLDVVGWLDIVQTRFDVFEEGRRDVETLAYNAYAFGVGPRLGTRIAISSHIYLDLAATAGVVGPNRFLFTAGFGYGTTPRVHPRSGGGA